MRNAHKKRLRRATSIRGKFRVTIYFNGPQKRATRCFITPAERDGYIAKMKSKSNYIRHSTW